MQQQQYAAAVAPRSHLSLLQQTLTQYGVEEPALSQILANPQVTLELARAWMLYADGQPGLERKAGYVIQRLLKTPPDVPAEPDLLLVAALGEDDLAGFVQRRALELRMAAEISFPDGNREAQYQAWLRFYGHERDATHSDGMVDETTLERDRGRASRWQPDVG
jgi:hypothetical protein